MMFISSAELLAIITDSKDECMCSVFESNNIYYYYYYYYYINIRVYVLSVYNSFIYTYLFSNTKANGE